MDGDFLHEEPPAYGGSRLATPLAECLCKLDRALKHGDATEHTHRPALKELLEALDEGIIATMAAMVAYLAGPEAGYVTGASLAIDGGFTT
jgi:NAD(P)-dependent dehydrogenase (short-subunit alcohol dehydrogenase family)